jgi:tRNA pseudouridine55 synthase
VTASARLFAKPADRPAIDGVIIVAKEPGPTSHDVVGLIRRLTGARRVGHGGTLDPFAAGVLPVFLGHGTRLAEYHLADEKEYRALIAFGARSTTDDIDGELTATDGAAPTREAVEGALAGFRGQIEQVPPDYSAVRVAGRHAYELARHGRKPALRARTVTIARLELTGWDDSIADRPTATLELHCSAGTYVRALARDLGENLGCGAYLAALTRTASGPFRIAAAHDLDAVRRMLSEGRLKDVLLPPDTGLEHLARVTVDAAGLKALTKGQSIRSDADTAGEQDPVLLVDGKGTLAAVARRHGLWLQPEKVFLGPG